MKRIKRPGHYYGLEEISKAIGCSTFAVRSRIIKYHFPAFKVPGPNGCGGHGYCWYTNDQLINQWYRVQIDQSRTELIATATGRKLAYTRGNDPLPVQSGSLKTGTNN